MTWWHPAWQVAERCEGRRCCRTKRRSPGTTVRQEWGKSGVKSCGPKVARGWTGSAVRGFSNGRDTHGSSARVCRSCKSWLGGNAEWWRMKGIEPASHANPGIGWPSFRSNAATAATPKTPRKRIAFSIVLPPLLRLLRCCGIVCAGGARWNIRFGGWAGREGVPGWLYESRARVG